VAAALSQHLRSLGETLATVDEHTVVEITDDCCRALDFMSVATDVLARTPDQPERFAS
jgi:hypothetical protein